MKKSIRLAGIVTILSSIVFVLVLGISNTVHADDDGISEVAKKWLLSQYYQCVQSSALQKDIDRDKVNNKEVSKTVFSGGEKQPLPSLNYFSRTSGTSEINCTQVLNGVDGKLDGVLAIAGVPYNVKWSQLSSGQELAKKLGYDTIDKTAAEFKIVANEHKKNTTSWFNGKEVVKEYPDTDTGSAVIKVTPNDNGSSHYERTSMNFLKDIKVILDAGMLTVEINKAGFFSGCSGENFTSEPITLYADPEQTYNEINNKLNLVYVTFSCYSDSPNKIETTEYTYSFGARDIVESVVGSKYHNDGDEATARASLISLGRNPSTLKLTEDELYDLYWYYLDKTVPTNAVNRIKCQDDSSGSSNGLTKVHLKKDGTWKIYYMNLYGVDLDKQFYTLANAASISKISLQGIIGWFNSHNATEIGADEECSEEQPDDSTSIEDTVTPTAADKNEVNCFNSAGALGWIVCPILTAVSGAVNGLYDAVVKPFLEVNVGLFDRTGSSGGASTYKAWQTFQGIANVLFIIAFLVVIFSQLTGIGIDNYGIKRILPKLIIAAVLINMSYIICQACVDISNILGAGFEAFFRQLSVAAAGTSIGNEVAGGLISAATNLGLGYLAISTAEIWVPIVLPSLFLGLITMLIAILFTFVLLGVREAGILILTVISPLAFAAYMLPNTKSLYDRWKKLFQGLLLVYPICGLLMGGGAFAGKVLLAANNDNSSGAGFGATLIAMLLTVVPFFMIPSLLRSSMSAMGNIGARISNFGDNLGRSARGAVGNSEAMKDFRTNLNAGVNANGQKNWIGRRRDNAIQGKGLGRFTAYRNAAQRSALSGQAAYNKRRLENDPKTYAAQMAKMNASYEAAQIENEQALFERSSAFIESDFWGSGDPSSAGYVYGGLAKEVNDVIDSGDQNKITAMINSMSKKSDHHRDVLRRVLSDRTKAGAAGSLVDASGNAVDANAQSTLRAMQLAFRDNAGEWKADDRRIDQWSNATSTTKGGQGFSLDTYGAEKNASLAEKVSQQYMVDADDSAIADIYAAVQSGTLSDAATKNYQDAAYKALHAPGSENLKNERRVKLETIAGNYRPQETTWVNEENAAKNRGKQASTFTFTDEGTSTIQFATNENIYRPPESFFSPVKTGQHEVSKYTRNKSGDYIYTRQIIDDATKKVLSTQKWNASTAQFKND